MDQVVCECGRVWEFTKVKLPGRDRDSDKCDCGRVLRTWNGSYMYMSKLVRDIESPDSTAGNE